MRIALITDGIYPYVVGGMQKHSTNLAAYLSAEGVKVDLYHTDRGTGEDIHELTGMSPEQKKNITSIRIPWPSGDRLPGHYLRELAIYSQEALARYLDGPPADFIYSKSLTGQAFIKARKSGNSGLPPVGLKAHGYEMFQQAPSLKTALQLLMLRKPFRHYSCEADVVFSYGGKITSLLEETVGVDRSRIAEIPGAVADEWLVQAPKVTAPQPIRFVFVGRYERRKGVQELHQTIEQHPEWQETCSFTFIGPIPEERRLSFPHVSYLGKVTEKEKLMTELRNHHVMVTPSHSEGMPNVIMEGMASGLAVIGTDVGAVSTLVNKDTGWLIPQISADSLGETIHKVLETDPEIIFQKRASALEHIKATFTWKQVTKTTIQTIQTFLQQT